MTIYPSGIKFPFQFSDAGTVFRAEGDEKISSNLHALVKSPVNSRVIRKAVGTVSYQKVFRNLIVVGFDPLRSLVNEAIAEFEPRAKVFDIVIASEEREKDTVVVIEISFMRRSSSELNSLRVEL